jgi:hypothetical protein
MSGSATPATMLRPATTGLQDLERLQPPTGQPSMQFYRRVILQRTRFASQWRRVNFDNAPDFGRKATVTLPPSAELISRAILVVSLPDIKTPQTRARDTYAAVAPKWSWTNGLGNAICSDVQMTINNEVVEQFDSRLLEVINQQEATMDHFTTTNQMLQRDAQAYTDITYSVANGLLYIVFPFWWNRGIGPQALPIQALNQDKVQISCTFRPVQECVYTSTRSTVANGLPSAAGNPGAAPLPLFAGCPFLNAAGAQIPGVAMPKTWAFQDAYWLVEYVSLEDREAAAFRIGDLQIPFTQHVALQPYTTNGTSTARIPLTPGGLIRDMTWVAQRVEAPAYNAWFLFSRELSDLSGEAVWWPDARIPSFNYGDGYMRPAFCDRRSDPIASAAMYIRGKLRFEHDGPSMFRSLIPALNCAVTPIVDRYVYRYDFGFWSSGGLAEALTERPVDEMRGAANWSKLPRRELVLDMVAPCGLEEWVVDTSQAARTYTGPNFSMLETDFAAATAGFRIELRGATPSAAGDNGVGALVNGIIDWQQIRRLPGYLATHVRVVSNGSAALIAQTGAASFVPVAVAGGGGFGRDLNNKGGAAGSAVVTGRRGGPLPQLELHTATAAHGGGGGGRIGALPTATNGTPARGDPDGIQMPMNSLVFLATLQSTGGSTAAYAGGDGWYGGGSGADAGGGGGSMISEYVTQTQTTTQAGVARVVITPLRRATAQQPNFNIYVWLTRWNMLRITNGRGAVMFAS